MRNSLVLTCLLLSGCNLFKPVSEPKEITFEQAMSSLGSGLYKLKQSEKDINAGLIAAEVEVTFNINATQTSNGKIELGITRPTTDDNPFTKNASASIGSTAYGLRSNQIRIKFINLLTLPKDSYGATGSPEKIADLPKKSGVTTWQGSICYPESPAKR